MSLNYSFFEIIMLQLPLYFWYELFCTALGKKTLHTGTRSSVD